MNPDSVTPHQTPLRRIDPAGIAIAATLAAVAIVLVVDASRMSLTTAYGMGPDVMPIVIAIGLGLLAVGNLVNAFRGEVPQREGADYGAVLLMLAGLALLIAIIGLGGGYILATTVLFVATARAFGRHAFFADLAIGLTLTTLTYLAFDRLLTLSLPAGPLERLL